MTCVLSAGQYTTPTPPRTKHKNSIDDVFISSFPSVFIVCSLFLFIYLFIWISYFLLFILFHTDYVQSIGVCFLAVAIAFVVVVVAVKYCCFEISYLFSNFFCDGCSVDWSILRQAPLVARAIGCMYTVYSLWGRTRAIDCATAMSTTFGHNLWYTWRRRSWIGLA